MKRRTQVVIWLALIALAVGLVLKLVATPYLVIGESMTPTLRHMDLCLMRKTWGYRPQRGDIVVFRTADDPPLYFVKRVIALPAETIGIRQGVVQIDDKPLPEPYTPPNPTWEMPATIVPADKVFVIGDNRAVALDETLHGFVATRLIQARLVAHWRWKR